MNATLKYGANRTLRIDSEAAFELLASPAAPVESAAEQACAALQAPIGFPPLASCLAPGDQIALAVAAETPSVDQVVAGTLQALAEAGVQPDQVVVVSADPRDTQRLQAKLADAAGLRFETHNPEDDQQLCFAGATQDGQPVMLCRPLVEADVLLPLSPVVGDAEGGPFAGLFPAFSDAATRRRLRETPATEHAAESRFATEADEAGWLAGVNLMLQVAPDNAGGVARVFAGPAQAVASAAREFANAHGRHRVRRRADLVVATLTGDEHQQSWASLARALKVADGLVAPGGAVALCTELAEPFDDPIHNLLAAGDPDQAAQELAAMDTTEAAAASGLIAAIERGPVYLMSGFDPNLVEELGLAPVANERELSRLVSRRQSCIAIEGAQHAVVELAEEDNPTAPSNGSAS